MIAWMYILQGGYQAGTPNHIMFKICVVMLDICNKT